MESTIEKKALKQQIALNISKVHPFLFLEWFTGLGKTKAALSIMDYHRDADWVILCKELNHMLTWTDEAIKWGIDFSTVKMVSYDSIHKLPQDKPLNIIMDEAHALTPARLKKMQKLQINRIVALTATMPLAKRHLLSALGKFQIYTITMAKAIEEGILPAPTIYKVVVRLPIKTMRIYRGLTTAIDTAMFDGDEEKAKILGMKRKRLLSEAKTPFVRKYLDYEKRFVCFTGSIDQCNIIGGENAIHSDNKDRVATILSFNELKIDHLFAVNMLRESMNLRNIEIGYIVQLDNQEKSTIQMLGRSFRSKNPIMYVFIAQGTVDERYAQTAFSQIPEKYIRTIADYV